MSQTLTQTLTQTFWIAHSPYSDGTFRGLEKSAHGTDSTQGLLLFETLDACQNFCSKLGLGYRPVPVSLIHPRVRQPLNVV